MNVFVKSRRRRGKIGLERNQEERVAIELAQNGIGHKHGSLAGLLACSQ